MYSEPTRRRRPGRNSSRKKLPNRARKKRKSGPPSVKKERGTENPTGKERDGKPEERVKNNCWKCFCNFSGTAITTGNFKKKFPSDKKFIIFANVEPLFPRAILKSGKKSHSPQLEPGKRREDRRLRSRRFSLFRRRKSTLVPGQKRIRL